MAVDILVTGSVVFTGDRVIRDGFVYIKGSRVVDVGQAPVPEEYSYAALLLGGRGRIVAPGLAAYADVAAYPLRLLKPRLPERARFYSSFSLDDLVRVALPALYELHMSGVSTIVVEGPKGLAVTLSESLGGFYEAAVPACTGEASELAVAGEGCEGNAVFRVDGDVVTANGRRVLSLVARESYSVHSLGLGADAYMLSLKLREQASIPGGVIRPGERAEVVVYDATVPPALLTDLAGWYDYRRIYSIGARVESLVVGDDVIVDGGEHLRIVRKHFNDVRRLAEAILGKGGER